MDRAARLACLNQDHKEKTVGELLFGCMTLRGRAEQVFDAPCRGHLSRRALLGFDALQEALKKGTHEATH